MALAYRTSAVGGNTVSGTSPTAVITPVANDLFIVFCAAAGNSNTSPTCADNNSGSYTLVGTAASSVGILSCFVRTALVPNTTSTTVTVTCGAHTAVEIAVMAISGGSVAGSSAIAQFGTQINQLTGATPAPSLSNPVISGDIVLSAVANATNPASVTVSPGTTLGGSWTLNQNVGQTLCGLGVESSAPMFNHGSGAVTWGGVSTSNFAAFAVELTAPPTNAGANLAKVQTYAVLTPPIGVSTSKVQTYAVLTPPTGVSVAKIQVYAVLAPSNTNPPVWPSLSPPPGYVGNPYSFTWDLTAAASPTTYTLFSGSLPPGLSLSNIIGGDGNGGQITGTPTTAGSYSFVITATNSYGSANEPMTIIIYNPTGVGAAYTYIG